MSIINLYDKSENLYFIGGIVRDELLGISHSDIDLTYVGNAIEFAKSLDFGKITQINEEFGAVHLLIDNKNIDITSTRSEIYPQKGQLPLVNKIGCSLKKDVLRRDFTINAIAKNCKNGEIVDYTNGIEDLKNKKLRILHDDSFIDDPTRIIRGLKFAIRFDLELETHTKELQNSYLNNVNYSMSYKRLKDELVDTFNLNEQKVLDEFINQNMYKLLANDEFEPYICNIEEFIKPYLCEIKHIWLIYLSGFNLKNLPLTHIEQKILDDYKKLLNTDLSSDFKIYKAFEQLSIESVLIYGILKNENLVKNYLTQLRHIKITITGDDLKLLGYSPSKKFKSCFDAVLQSKLNEPNLTKAQELSIVKKIM